ncbi:MAG: hypothetical protein GX447_02440 [Elusimicrobia bacterium]|nr:hypothetical protein [Elusimicrobiota bacterium]
MKKNLLKLTPLIMFLCGNILFADEIVKKDTGEVLQGQFIEIKTNEYYRIKTADGKVYQIPWENTHYVKFEEIPQEIKIFKQTIPHSLSSPEYDSKKIENEYKKAKDQSFLKMTIDMGGKQKISGEGLSNSADINTAFSFSFEFMFPSDMRNKLGIGVTYQFPRSIKDSEGDFNFVPLYAFLKMPLGNENDLSGYFLGHLGYNFFMGDDDYKLIGDLSGGLYYGAGIGFQSQNILFEFLYSVNNGSYKVLDYNFDVKYSKIGLSIGFIF